MRPIVQRQVTSFGATMKAVPAALRARAVPRVWSSLSHRVKSGALHTMRGPNAGTGTPSGYPAVDEPKHQHQSRHFIARQHPSDLFRRDRRHQFGTQFEPLTAGNTGSEAPEHGGHARSVHRGRFYDDDTGDWLASMAEGQ